MIETRLLHLKINFLPAYFLFSIILPGNKTAQPSSSFKKTITFKILSYCFCVFSVVYQLTKDEQLTENNPTILKKFIFTLFKYFIHLLPTFSTKIRIT